MPKKQERKLSKHTEEKEQPSLKLERKPNLDEFLKKADDWYDKWGAMCAVPLNTKQAYLDYMKMYYVQYIQDMSNLDYNKFVKQTSKQVVQRFEGVLDNLTKKTK